MRVVTKYRANGSVSDYMRRKAANVGNKPVQSTMIRKKTEEELIDEEVAKGKKERERMKLLAEQLKLPPSKRSQALMRKYKLSVVDDNSLVDKYAEYSSNVDPNRRVQYSVYFPEDTAVADLRPENHLVSIEGVEDSNGDLFDFHFHCSITEEASGVIIYAVDLMPGPTYVSAKEHKLLDKGDFDIFKALYYFKKKDDSYTPGILKVFKHYDILPANASSTDDLYGPNSLVDLKIKNLDLKVVYSTLTKDKKAVQADNDSDLVEKLVAIEAVDKKQTDDLNIVTPVKPKAKSKKKPKIKSLKEEEEEDLPYNRAINFDDFADSLFRDDSSDSSDSSDSDSDNLRPARQKLSVDIKMLDQSPSVKITNVKARYRREEDNNQGGYEFITTSGVTVLDDVELHKTYCGKSYSKKFVRVLEGDGMYDLFCIVGSFKRWDKLEEAVRRNNQEFIDNPGKADITDPLIIKYKKALDK